jgi:predicted TIM-barrel fold metal-dependent hydrolase
VIDGHVHVWADDPLRYPWRPINGAEPPTVRGQAAWVLEVLTRHGVMTAVAVQTRAYGYDNSYLADTLHRFPDRLIGVCALDPLDPEAPTRLAELARDGFRGVRLDPLGDGGRWLWDGSILPLWDAAGALGLVVELMIGPEQLPGLHKLVRRTPVTRVVVEHLARYQADPSQGHDELLSLADLPNAYLKISALASISAEPAPHRDLHPLLGAVVRAFGAERLMWSSDMPWIGEAAYSAELAAVRALPFLSERERARIMGGTARVVWRAA